MPTTSPALDLAKRLNSDGFLTVDVDLFVGEFGGKNRQVLIMDSVGNVPTINTLYENPAIQILVRGDLGESYVDVYAWAKSVYDYIINLGGPVNLNGNCYQSFAVEIALQALGKDDRTRHVLTMQFSTFRNFN